MNNKTKNKKRKSHKGILFFIALLLSLVFILTTQPAATADTAASEEKAVNMPDVPNGVQKIQQITFKSDTSLSNALTMLAAKYKRNIIPSPNVDGVVTTGILYDVTFEEAMDAILGYQFKWEDDGKFVWVYTAEEYNTIKMDISRMTSRVFTLYYITAEEAKNLLTPAMSDTGEMSATTAAEQNTAAGQGGDSYAMRDAIVVYDFPERIEKIEEMLRTIDKRPPAVMLDVTIMEATLDDKTEFGIDFSTIPGLTAATAGTTDVSMTGFASSVTSGGLSIGMSIDDIDLFVRALESVTDTSVLANPKIMALNKQAGHLLLGEEEGYLTLTTSNADGATQQVEFLESGTKLEFRPFICKEGYIRLEIYPEQSEGDVEALGDFVLPNKRTTQLKTNIMVKDGKTIVIGGLFKDEIKKTYTQVPVLGDLPFIGTAFRSTEDTSVRKELIVLITPTIVDDPEVLEDHAAVSDVDVMMHGAHKSLEWFNRTRLMEDRYALAVKYYSQGDVDAAMAELNYILDMRPRYKDAIKLREKIIKETSPEDYAMLERIMLQKIED